MERKERALTVLLGGHSKFPIILSVHRRFWAGVIGYRELHDKLMEIERRKYGNEATATGEKTKGSGVLKKKH